MMTPAQKYNALLAQGLIDAFQMRNMEGFYCETKEEALAKVLEWIPENSTVSCGGSATLNEIGFREAMKVGNYVFLDPHAVQGMQEIEKVAHEAMHADYYLMSANAISLAGELVNVDGIGNRIGALAYGPKKIIVVAGLNKVEPTLDAAVHRVKTKASQLCLLAYNQKIESFEALTNAAEGLASHLMITSKSAMKDRIKILLVGESLGA